MGPFHVLADGRLTLRDPEQPPGFRFVWQDNAVKVGLQKDRVKVRAMLGRVPSTIASSAELRQSVFDMLRQMVTAVPQHWRLRLLPDHCVAVDVDDMLDTPPTAIELLTRLTIFVMELQPYLDVASEAGLEAAVGTAPGTAKA